MHGWHHRAQGMESVMRLPKRPAGQRHPYASLFLVEFVQIHLGNVQIRTLQSGYRFYLLQSQPVQSQCLLLQLQTDIQLPRRSEEHTSELQSRENLVCRLLLEKQTE